MLLLGNFTCGDVCACEYWGVGLYAEGSWDIEMEGGVPGGATIFGLVVVIALKEYLVKTEIWPERTEPAPELSAIANVW